MKNITAKKFSRMALSALFIFVLLATPIVLGCGKKAPPKPPKVSSTSQLPDKG
ncbi:MAG: hypothetical protein IME98_06535 [Proteobacteria bacterium]|nr:hypothetical protein [Pseudomonadota bacterium]